MKFFRITSALLLLGLISISTAQNQNDASQSPSSKQIRFNKDEISLDLEAPTGPVLPYSNNAPQNYNVPQGDSNAQSIPSQIYSKSGLEEPEGTEDMETAGTITIGRHSGRFFGPGVWLGAPSFTSYRYNRPRPAYYYPRRYHGYNHYRY